MRLRIGDDRGAILGLVVLLVAGAAFAGDPREGNQLWTMAVLQGGFGFVHPGLDRVTGYLELQGRFRSFDEETEVAFLPRLALGYALTSRLQLFAGFANVVTDPPSHAAVRRSFSELRPYQQLTWNLPVRGFTLQSRTRLEQRIIEDNLGWRLREFVKGTVDVPGSDRAYLAAYEELFFDLDDTTWPVGGQRRGFRQNRLFAGLGYRVDPAKHVAVEAGYLNQWIDRRKEDRLNHVLSLNLFLSY